MTEGKVPRSPSGSPASPPATPVLRSRLVARKGRLLRTLRSSVLGLLSLAIWAGCAGSGPPEPAPVYRNQQADYLLPPLEGYGFSVPGEVSRRLAEGYEDLRSGRIAEGRAIADELIRQDPLLHPARVLRAQCDLEEGLPRAAMQILVPIVEPFPEYRAAQLALARSAELAGETIEAYGAYRQIRDLSSLAFRKSWELEERALSLLHDRILEEANRGRFELAEEELLQLEAWASGSQAALEARWALADLEGDLEAALQAVRALAELRPDDVELVRERATLEVQVGDPRTGMSLFRELAESSPDDGELADLLAWAEFRWRFAMMPAEVQVLGRNRVLSRSDYAVLLYWLFPEVRYGRAAGARIASDVLDHPQREAIVRVLNLGLMDVDPSGHLFEPDRSVTRVEVLGSLLELLERVDPPLACVQELVVNPRPSLEGVCGAAVSCRLLSGSADCLVSTEVDGQDALELIRRTQEVVESAKPSSPTP